MAGELPRACGGGVEGGGRGRLRQRGGDRRRAQQIPSGLRTVVWTRNALRDLDAIQEFLAAGNPRAAFRLTQTILDRVGSILGHHAEAGRIGRVARIARTRELVLSDLSYIVVYRSRASVEILAVMHAAREWPDEFRN